MDVLTLCFLLLPLTVCSDSEVTFVRTVEREDVTPICTNETQSIITLIVCQISTERSRGELCRLTYRYMEGFKHDCDSRFTLMMEKQTAFLHLMDLTAEDSGNYSCECSLPGGTNITHLTLTVTGGSAEMSLHRVLPGVSVFVFLTLLILGFILRGKRSQSRRPDGESADIEPYSTFIRTDSGLYSTAKVVCSEKEPAGGTEVSENGVYSLVIMV